MSDNDPKGGCAFYVCLERKASLTLASDTRIINKDLNQTEPRRLSNHVPFFFSAYLKKNTCLSLDYWKRNAVFLTLLNKQMKNFLVKF